MMLCFRNEYLVGSVLTSLGFRGYRATWFFMKIQLRLTGEFAGKNQRGHCRDSPRKLIVAHRIDAVVQKFGDIRGNFTDSGDDDQKIASACQSR
jgi:hypothetical protein